MRDVGPTRFRDLVIARADGSLRLPGNLRAIEERFKILRIAGALCDHGKKGVMETREDPLWVR